MSTTHAPTVSRVADVMATPVVTTVSTDTVRTAARQMRDARVGSVVVTANDWVVVILTRTDLVRAAAAGHLDQPVAAWMTPDPETFAPDLSAERAWAHLNARGFRHAPVVVGDEAVGVVSARDLSALATIEPATKSLTVHPGLKGVTVANTSIGDVRGQEGFYHYRQYAAVEVSTTRPLTDVWKLVIDGDLPDRRTSAEFAAEMGRRRRVPDLVLPVLEALAATDDVTATLRTAVSAYGAAAGFAPLIDLPTAVVRDQALDLTASVAPIVASLWRLRNGLPPVEPDHRLSPEADYLRMLTGSEVSPDHARALGQYLALAADHGFNNSTFTARVVASSGADLAAAIAAAVGALSGPLHGGALARALDTLDRVAQTGDVGRFVREAIRSGERIMGFGHPVYKTADPRALALRAIALELGGPTVDAAIAVEAEVFRTLQELKPGRQLHTNVDYYAAVVLDACGLYRALFVPTFAIARTIGWCAHVLEQHQHTQIVRPGARYTGAPAPQPVPHVA